MSFENRPTFGATPKVEPPPVAKAERPEVGAIWNRKAKASSFEFLSIKLELSKDKLKELINGTGDTATIKLVAFPNKNHVEDSKRPNFRVYEEINKD